MSKKASFEQLNEIQMAEIREIFTLFDKNSDGYVNTNQLGTIIRALGMNPSQTEVQEMEKEIDGNETGSFDHMMLISLIAKKPKKEETLEDLTESIKILAEGGTQEENQRIKINTDILRNFMLHYGEKMQEVEFEEILDDCADLINDEDNMIIDDFANYLITH